MRQHVINNVANLKIKLLFTISYTFVLCSGELSKSIDLSHWLIKQYCTLAAYMFTQIQSSKLCSLICIHNLSY